MPNLSPCAITPVLSITDGKPVALSTDIARVFGKEHRHVIRSIENLLSELGTERAPNFGLTSTDVLLPNGGVRKDKAYLLTRDGFTLLAMSFTGRRALQFKLAYIDAFNEMERHLLEQAKKPSVRYLSAEEQSAINQRAHALAQQRYKPLREELMQDYLAGEVDELDKWEPRKGRDGLSERPFQPTPMTDAEREMAESVFKSRRYLMYFDQDGKPAVYGLEDDQFVTSAEKLPAAIRNAGVSPFNSRQITELLSACVDRLGFDMGRQ